MRKTRLMGYLYELSVGYETIDVSDIANIYKYLMKKHNIA